MKSFTHTEEIAYNVKVYFSTTANYFLLSIMLMKTVMQANGQKISLMLTNTVSYTLSMCVCSEVTR